MKAELFVVDELAGAFHGGEEGGFGEAGALRRRIWARTRESSSKSVTGLLAQLLG